MLRNRKRKQKPGEDDVVPDISGTERLDFTPSLEYSHCHQSYEFKGFNKELQCLCSAGRVTGPGFRPGTSETNQLWVTSARYWTGSIRQRFILVFMFLEEMTRTFQNNTLYPILFTSHLELSLMLSSECGKSSAKSLFIASAAWRGRRRAGFTFGPTARAIKRLCWVKVKSNRSLLSL